MVTALELYRLQKISLVVAYIVSVHREVFKLIRTYESDGLIRIRGSLQMPVNTSGLSFNPNAETEFNSETVDFNVRDFSVFLSG
jgi:hypothetical protein